MVRVQLLLGWNIRLLLVGRDRKSHFCFLFLVLLKEMRLQGSSNPFPPLEEIGSLNLIETEAHNFAVRIKH